MASIKELNEKKQLISSINKITKAMELVAIAKSKKSLKNLLKYRSYYQEMLNLVFKIIDDKQKTKNFDGICWIIFTSDLGLAGGYNSNIIKIAHKEIKPNDIVYIIGHKGETLKNTLKVKEMFFFTNSEAIEKSSEITSIILHHFFSQNLQIKAIYTKYVSQLQFEPKTISVIPIDLNEHEIEKAHYDKEIEFEPSKEALFLNVVETYVESFLIGLFRESKVSENTSRRIAMENASNNGEDLLKELSITYNRARQTKITQEISEIIGGSEALN